MTKNINIIIRRSRTTTSRLHRGHRGHSRSNNSSSDDDSNNTNIITISAAFVVKALLVFVFFVPFLLLSNNDNNLNNNNGNNNDYGVGSSRSRSRNSISTRRANDYEATSRRQRQRQFMQRNNNLMKNNGRGGGGGGIRRNLRKSTRRVEGEDPDDGEEAGVVTTTTAEEEKMSKEIATLRSGSCSAVPYGNLQISKKRELTDLPLNELMIQLSKPAYVTPPNPYGATIVDIALYVYEVAQINPADNTFLMEAFLDMTWCDPRLRFNHNNQNNNTNQNNLFNETASMLLLDDRVLEEGEKIFLEKDAERELEHIWWPTVYFVNEIAPRRIENEELIIYGDGTVEYREKFGVPLSTNYDMRGFPFDTQVLVAEIESFAWSSEKLVFHIEKDIIGFSDEFEIPEFVIQGIDEHLEERMEVRDRHPFSELMVEVTVVRNPTFYVTKVILPLSLIVIISWSVFWMDQEALADRMAISFTGVLTSVAYQFIVADSLPRHIYNTFLDNFVLLSFVIMVLTIAENILVSMLYKRNMKDRSARMDFACRFIFPITYIVAVGILAAVHI